MKKTLILLVAVSFFTACNNDKSSKDKNDRNSSDNQNKDDYRNNENNTDNNKNESRDKEDNTASWPRSDENKFMDDCEGTAKQNVGAARANEYCDCMLQKIKKMYSSYMEADRKLAGRTQEEINQLAADCNQQ